MPNTTRIVGPAANPAPARAPKARIFIPDRVAERASTRFNENVDGCYISTYSVGSHGYAQIGWNHKGQTQTVTAHRAAWVHANGTQIPVGMTIDHLCAERRCVNPNHLRLLTNFENARRTFGRDWPVGECANGHPNSRLVQNSRGRWECVDCRKIWASHRKPKTPTPKKPAAKKPAASKPIARRSLAKPVLKKPAMRAAPAKSAPKPSGVCKPPVKRTKATHCARGHEFTPENTYTTPGGDRWCRECMKMREANRPKRKRITTPDGVRRWETHQEARERISSSSSGEVAA